MVKKKMLTHKEMSCVMIGVMIGMFAGMSFSNADKKGLLIKSLLEGLDE